jgi:hypothetical protein
VKHWLLSILVFITCVEANAQETTSYLSRQGTATQLNVNGKPMLILGGELGNSSASSISEIERIFPKLHTMGLNTVFCPAYWDLLEPTEGQYDFTLIDKAISEARKDSLKIVFLWFGAWKNSMSCYAPEWFKKDFSKFPRAHSKSGKPLEIASALSENVYQADSRAFTKLMKHIAGIDKGIGTVIMIQIENEIGMLGNARDYSDIANKAFNSEVPTTLIKYLQKNKSSLHPQMSKKWQDNGYKTKGNWETVFGKDLYTDEMFTAWNYAKYVERLAQIARAEYPVPLYVNAALNSRDRKPGEYPSGGPLAHLIDIWHCAAPSIDILAPDLYDNNFTGWVAKYKLHNNPFFTPEVRLADNDGVRAFYVFGELDGISFSPFSIENASSDKEPSLVKAYAKLHELMPLILKHQGKSEMNGLLFDNINKERIIQRDGYKMTCRHYFTLPWDARAANTDAWPEGGGIIIRIAKDDYIIAGSGIVISFDKSDNTTTDGTKDIGEDGFAKTGGQTASPAVWDAQSVVGIASVDQVSINTDGTLKYIRRLNGDEDHQGRHVRISVDDFQILHVRLYEYK